MDCCVHNASPCNVRCDVMHVGMKEIANVEYNQQSTSSIWFTV